MTSWLSKHRKADLQQLALHAGLDDPESLLKDDLVLALDKHLRGHASTLSTNPIFSDYYGRSGSPTKRAPSVALSAITGAEADKPRRRRTLKVKEELDNAFSESPPLTSTPSIARRIPLPPSPAAVADAVEQQTARLGNHLSGLWVRSPVPGAVNGLREVLSSVVGIESVVVLLEVLGLYRALVPWRFAFDIPAVAGYGGWQVFLPDLFVLVTSAFWAPVLLWASTSLAGPLIAGWFFNLGRAGAPSKAYKVDPLAFNVAKALATWLVYARGGRIWGLVSDQSAAVVEIAVPGGWSGVVTGAGVGAVGSVYEAILRK
ncbi:hypothetical protein EJ06DRAFT_373116 [Trichodelitschia bisporula]|uniref:Uncharacterized protein n=1 Tax=Trichodelitschia bisporula TaxID=703511 RepID=A0A6G1I1L3_9PEZI|nr:hypothetical protein EJ06DRAFT_373116 [Trichodelitschia bisporula]